MPSDPERITTDPAVMGGAPCVRGLRVTARAVLDSLDSRGWAATLAAYPYLTDADLEAVSAWGARRLRAHAEDGAAFSALLDWSGPGRAWKVQHDAGNEPAVSVVLRQLIRFVTGRGSTVAEAIADALEKWGAARE